ncbi:hypothetical protein [Halomonas korlensis]|uniref:Replication protein n=1 Tax=Halomonas korlensis TaxID=463301 RepID=A0A1I7KM58_9GAMM|nr:hypothetical protein [Halomonas korlensis]SFU98512.1 hypothetical protein SAMN04487955_12617 [Halomonas korlensis]
MQHVKHNLQPDLFDGLAEARYYHDPKRFGTFAILRDDPTRKKKVQRTYPLRELAQVIDSLDPNTDTWISQGEFKGFNRRVVNLLRTGVIFADLDYYYTPFSSYDPEAMAWAVVQRCHDEGLPIPSVVLFSGRGLQVKWLLDDPIPGRALPRWNAVQQALGAALADMGADPSARDASRVLRLCGTVNTKTQEYARVVYVNGSMHAPTAYSFDEFADSVLPLTRDELQQKREARQARRERLILIEGHRQGPLKGLHGGQLAWDRMHDLKRLAELRGGLQEGERMTFLLWQMNFAFLSGQIHPSQSWYEAKSLAASIDPSWNMPIGDLSTLYAKAKAHQRGERIELNGREYTPLYTPKNQTLIEIFRITPDEERQLRTIVSEGESLRRHREREKARRRAQGAQSREEYLKATASRKTQARALREQGLSIRKIATAMETSVSQVQRLLR